MNLNTITDFIFNLTKKYKLETLKWLHLNPD